MTCEILTLIDPDSGALARFLPGVGCNCFQFQVPTRSGPVEVLWAEPGFEQGDKRASGSGNPVLFPFPGRIQGTTLHWDGRDWPLAPGDGLGNAIHGFVHERAWRVVELESSRLVAEFQASQDDPQLLQSWPADFRIRASYTLRGAQLSATYRIENPAACPLPYGLGTHPYFRLPLGGTSAAGCRVHVPVQRCWELAAMIPTGSPMPPDVAARLERGQMFRDMTYDDVFSDLVARGGHCEATIDDPESGRRMTLTFDSGFRACVLYTPPHREALCIEPYTCIPDPFRLESLGIDAGLRVLDPGQSCELHVDIELCELS